MMFESKSIIDKYLGIPYKHIGRDLKGLDCWGLIIHIYNDIGIQLPDMQDYAKNWALRGDNHFKDNYYNKWVKVENKGYYSLNMGDLALFYNKQEICNHAGIYLHDYKFIHACRAGVVVTRLSGTWLERLEGIYRYDNN